MRTRIAVLLLSLNLAAACPAYGVDSNFPDRKALSLNTCPFVQLSSFWFGNEYEDRRYRFKQNLSWKNIGTSPLVAFEVVVLKYDAFDQRLVGSRWVVTGHNSADWDPLNPGEESADGSIGFGTEEVFTAIAYVRSARLADGTVWRANEVQLMSELRKIAPGIKDFGSTRPDPKTAKE